MCISPVTSPSRRRRVEERVGSGRRSRRARAPSRRSRRCTYCWRIPSVAPSGPPEYAYQPPSGAMFAKPCSVRKRSISSSGLIPGSSRRNDLEDQLVVEHDRCVRLLGADRAHVEQLAAETGEALDRRGTRRCPRRLAASARSASRSRARARAAARRGRRSDLSVAHRVEQLVDVVRAGVVARSRRARARIAARSCAARRSRAPGRA